MSAIKLPPELGYKPSITLTGIDAQTDLTWLQQMLDTYERFEPAILFSATPNGRNRYPAEAEIVRLLRFCKGRAALHICGHMARQRLRDGYLDHLLSPAGRVQVNGVVSLRELSLISQFYSTKQIIVQRGTEEWPTIFELPTNLSFLVDASGGRGIERDEWPLLDLPRPVGFAGGLGPHNLLVQLPRIAAVARPGWWVDMESNIRTEEDWFSVERADAALSVFFQLFP